jgi:hypothetical protein
LIIRAVGLRIGSFTRAVLRRPACVGPLPHRVLDRKVDQRSASVIKGELPLWSSPPLRSCRFSASIVGGVHHATDLGLDVGNGMTYSLLRRQPGRLRALLPPRVLERVERSARASESIAVEIGLRASTTVRYCRRGTCLRECRISCTTRSALSSRRRSPRSRRGIP